MKIVDIIPQTIIVRFELTVEEVDAISLALSKSRVDSSTEQEHEAARTLTHFAEMLNGLLERVGHVSDQSGK